MEKKKTELLRVMGLGSLALYGVGDMLGAGIYGLVGRAAGQMGNAVWMAFTASMLAAMLTGLSYACLGSRYPRAAGAAYVVHRAFHFPFLSYVLGLAVIASGLTSMATASRAFSGYFQAMIGHLPLEAIIVGFILFMTLVNFWGIKESILLNGLCTIIEVMGLAIVILVGVRYWGSVNYFETPATVEGSSGITIPLILQGAVLTFFSFVGFEDMLNVTEEVKEPESTFPKAVVLALILTTLIYLAISITAVSVVPYTELATSKQPLVDVVKRAAPWFPATIFSIISMFAVSNTALLNYIMGSRLIYGMANQGLMPHFLGKVHAQRRTPHRAILALMVIVLGLALSGDISVLAKATSVLLLSSFVIINGALIRLKLRADEPKGKFEVPIAVPAGGMLICSLLILNAQAKELTTAGIIVGGIVLLYFVMGPKDLAAKEIAAMES